MYDYKKVRLLGQGSYGKAYLCERDGSPCVVKQMDLKFMSEEEKQECIREARIMQQLRHPNIITYREVYQTTKGKLCIVMDYADGGDLSKVLEKSEVLPEPKILDWLTQMCLAIKHCHDRKIIHRDIKTKNMFLTKDMRIKLGDFGIAKVLEHTRDKIATMVGTPYNLAPELVENKPYSFKGDIWALGVIVYEMCCKCPPFDAESLPSLALKIVRGQYNPIPPNYSRELRVLIQQMLTVNPDRRPSVHQILQMPLITNRIKKFLTETIKKTEFDHTIMHNQNIKLQDETIPLIDEDEQQTPRQKKQLPDIKSPKQEKKADKKSDQKKLPEIKKTEKPPVTRQVSSRAKLQRQQPSTPELNQRKPVINIPTKAANRFITKESPDSFQGSDQIIEEKKDKNSIADSETSGSPKFFQPPKIIKRPSEKLNQISSYGSNKIQQKSEDDAKTKNMKYKINNNQRVLQKYIIRTEQSARKISDDFSQQYQLNIADEGPLLLKKISETPENSQDIYSPQKHVDKTTISIHQPTDENQFILEKQPSPKDICEQTTYKKKNSKSLNKHGDNQQTDEDKKVFKKQDLFDQKKVYKIIVKDPFKKNNQNKLKNSEEDLKQMLDELKTIVAEPEKPQKANRKSLEDLDLLNDRETEKLDDIQLKRQYSSKRQSKCQQQVNSWMIGESREEKQTRQEEQKQNQLKDQLSQKLGSNFDMFYKLSKFSSHLPDFGMANIKLTLIDRLRTDEYTAESIATLLVALVMQQNFI